MTIGAIIFITFLIGILLYDELIPIAVVLLLIVAFSDLTMGSRIPFERWFETEKASENP